jgi:hypothetical protein
MKEMFMVIFVEMSKPLATQGIQIEASRFRVLEHLAKLFYFRDAPWKNDRIKHLYSNTPETYFLPKSKKLPKKDFIYNNLWKDGEDSFTYGMFRKVISFLDDDYDQLNVSSVKKNPKIKKLMAFCSEYCLWAAERLSRVTNVYKEEVADIIEDLLKKHPY